MGLVPGPAADTKNPQILKCHSQPSVSTDAEPKDMEGCLFIGKNPPISGPMLLRPVLFKGQLYY